MQWAQYRRDQLHGHLSGSFNNGYPIYDLIPQDFLLLKTITSCIENDYRQEVLEENLRGLINPQINSNDKLIGIGCDEDTDAKCLIFSACIAASIAIRNNAKNKRSMQKTIETILHVAEGMRRQYIDKYGAYSQMTSACNTMINIIAAILDNRISTSELLYQVNRDCLIEDITPKSSVNQAFIHLAYLLPKKAHKHFKMDEDIHCEDWIWMCKYLDIRIKCLVVGRDAHIIMQHKGVYTRPVAATIVMHGHQTYLLLDPAIANQIEIEKAERLSFCDPEIRFAWHAPAPSHSFFSSITGHVPREQHQDAQRWAGPTTRVRL